MARSATDPDLQPTVRRDPRDLRDFVFQPTLRPLPARLDTLARFGALATSFPVRQQGQTGRCAGHALAALIDILRMQDRTRRRAGRWEPASAEMLYQMGRFYDQPGPDAGDRDSPETEGLRSLRSVIKGFYHHGACPARAADGSIGPDCWADGVTARMPSVEQARAARHVSLGAYCRLNPYLIDYHSAISEAGAVLVSATIHDGWIRPMNGRIGASQGMDGGTHAVVLVGYTEAGFLVLNSWGGDWGRLDGRPGLALWPYEDWAANVVDGWVLRLGVPAPEAFDVSIGAQGWNRVSGLVSAGSVPCIELFGHYVHMDDGHYVEHGSYPSDPEGWKVTRDHLAGRVGAGKDYRGILLWIPGSLEGIAPAFRRAAARKGPTRSAALYPYTAFWCNGFVEKSLEVLTTVFDGCHRRIGSLGPELDLAIEREVRGVGRAFWRDIEQSARRAVFGAPDLPEDGEGISRGTGPMADIFDDLLAMAETGIPVHIVCEGAGVLVLHELLRRNARRTKRRSLDQIAGLLASLDLIHPAIDLWRASVRVLPLVRAMNGGAARARIHLPGRRLEQRLTFGIYGAPLLHLISRSFEDRLDPSVPLRLGEPLRHDLRQPRRNHPSHPPRLFLGMADAMTRLVDEDYPPEIIAAFRTLLPPEDGRLAHGPINQTAFLDDRRIEQAILDLLRPPRAASPDPEDHPTD